MASIRSLPLPCLALVTDRSLCQDAPLWEKVAQAVAGGCNIVQLRERDLSAGQMLHLALRLRRVVGSRALLLVNDRLDVALAAGANGIHLPENGLPVAEARRIARRDLIVGRAVHSAAEALRAHEEGADYIQVGTIYPTLSHPDAVPAGPRLIQEVARQVRIPVLAVGGINADNVGEVIAAGAAGAAVISAVLASPSPQRSTADLWQVIHSAWAEATHV
jgi:thiamine-phosphate pyrophosphorylase